LPARPASISAFGGQNPFLNLLCGSSVEIHKEHLGKVRFPNSLKKGSLSVGVISPEKWILAWKKLGEQADKD